MFQKIVFVGLMATSLTGCLASIPEAFSLKAEEQALPDDWVAMSTEVQAIENVRLQSLQGNSALDSLIDFALNESPDVRQSALRLKEAELAIGREHSALWPSLSLDASGKRAKDRDASSDTSSIGNTVSSSVGLTWELDLWGRLSDLEQASALEADAVMNDLRGVRSLLIANMMRTWVRLGANHEIVELEKKRINSLQTAEDIISSRYSSGLGDLGDLDAARSATQSAYATLSERKNDHEQEVRRLNVLVGDLPGNRLHTPKALPTISMPMADTPMNVIGRRPDIIAAFGRIKSADKTALATYKDILPSFKLSADVSGSGSRLSDVFRSGSAWSLIGALSAPIFDAGLRKTNTEISEARAQRQWEDYRLKLLIALEEVENALAFDRHLGIQEGARFKAREHAKSAHKQQLEKYSAGLSDVITLLTSERTAFDATVAYLNVRRQRMENRIILALALGFGA